MPKFDHPQLVNRGAAGLITKVATPDSQKKAESQLEKEERIIKEAPKNRIAPSLKPLAVPLDSLTPDANNAKKHPEKSIRAIMLSLALFGQRKPLAAHKVGKQSVVIAGNGTLEAAKLLGWSKIAAAMDDDLSEAELAAYGMADNRSAEHGRWDFEQVAKLEQMVTEAGLEMVGWSLDELEVLRAADWTPPEMSDEEPETLGASHKLTFTDEQAEVIESAILKLQTREGLEVEDAIKMGVTSAEALKVICEEWTNQCVPSV